MSKDGVGFDVVAFDLDGVLVDAVSSWVYMHEQFGVKNSNAYQEYMDGNIDYLEFMRVDISLWLEKEGKVHSSRIIKALDSMPLMGGAKEAIDELHHAGLKTLIVSCGIKDLALRVQKDLAIHGCMANSLVLDDEGYLTGEGLMEVDLADKGKYLLARLKSMGMDPKRTVAIGNSLFDVPMFKVCGLGIAFNPDDQVVIDEADVVVPGKDLRDVLPIILD